MDALPLRATAAQGHGASRAAPRELGRRNHTEDACVVGESAVAAAGDAWGHAPEGPLGGAGPGLDPGHLSLGFAACARCRDQRRRES